MTEGSEKETPINPAPESGTRTLPERSGGIEVKVTSYVWGVPRYSPWRVIVWFGFVAARNAEISARLETEVLSRAKMTVPGRTPASSAGYPSYTPYTYGDVPGTTRPRRRIKQRIQIPPTSRLLVIPAAYILSFAPSEDLAIPSSSGSTNAPIGMTRARTPVDLTLMFSTRERMPCPNSWITIAKMRANQTANVEGT